jgi:hypothetical protein
MAIAIPESMNAQTVQTIEAAAKGTFTETTVKELVALWTKAKHGSPKQKRIEAALRFQASMV